MNQLNNNPSAISRQFFFSSLYTAIPSLILQDLDFTFALRDHFCAYFLFMLSLSAVFCLYNSCCSWFNYHRQRGFVLILQLAFCWWISAVCFEQFCPQTLQRLSSNSSLRFTFFPQLTVNDHTLPTHHLHLYIKIYSTINTYLWTYCLNVTLTLPVSYTHLTLPTKLEV